MAAVEINLDARLHQLVQLLGTPVDETVSEFIVLALFRRGQITSGKAKELLGMDRLAFIQYASRLGLPFFELHDDWDAEVKGLADL